MEKDGIFVRKDKKLTQGPDFGKFLLQNFSSQLSSEYPLEAKQESKTMPP